MNAVVHTQSSGQDDVHAGDHVDGDVPEVEGPHHVHQGEHDAGHDHQTEVEVAEHDEGHHPHGQQGQAKVPPELQRNDGVRLPSLVDLEIKQFLHLQRGSTDRRRGEGLGGNVCLFDDLVHHRLGRKVLGGGRQGGGHPVLQLHLGGRDGWGRLVALQTSVELEVELLLGIAHVKQKVAQVSVEHLGGVDLINARVPLLIYKLFEGSPPGVNL